MIQRLLSPSMAFVQHIQGDIGLWSEDEVRIAFVKWRNKVLEERERQRKEEERRRQEEGQKLEAHDKQREYLADNPEELLQKKSPQHVIRYDKSRIFIQQELFWK